MPYTRAWNNATPPGTRAAKEIDDAIREFKVDVDERLETLIDPTTTIDDDPLVLKPGITGTVTGRKMVYPPYLVQPINDDDDVSYADGYFQGDNNTGHLTAYMPITIPVGYVITLFEFYADKIAGASVTGRLLSRLLATGGAGTLDSGDIVRSAAGVGVASSAALSHTVLDTEACFVKFTGVNGSRYRIYGVVITYDKADSSVGF